MADDEAAVVAELVAELMLEHPELSLEECQAAVSESLGNRRVVAAPRAATPPEPEPEPPLDGSEPGSAGDSDGEEDAAMSLLRRRYAESQAKQEVERALAALDQLDSGGATAGDAEDATPAPDAEGTEPPRGDRPAEEVDDSWLMSDARQAARQALSAEEQAEIDEALYAAAREGFPKECEYLIGKGAAFDGWKSKNNATAIHAASANGHRACVAVLLEVGGTKAKMSKNKVRARPEPDLLAAQSPQRPTWCAQLLNGRRTPPLRSFGNRP
jgi:hypothetical protein